MLTRVLVAGGAVTLLAACSSSHRHAASEPTLRSETSSSDGASIGKSGLAVGSPLTVMTGDLCTSGAPVTITSVEAFRPKGLSVTGWGVRADDGGATDYRAPVSRVARADHSPVTTKCSGTARTELDVEVTGSSAVGTAKGFVLRYGDGRTAKVFFGVGLCSPAVSQDRCAATLPA